MNKSDVARLIAKRTTLTKRQVVEVLEYFVDVVEESLASGKKVYIDGLGVFEAKKRAPRAGRNPHTNKLVPIPACIVPNFKPSKRLKEKIYENIESEDEIYDNEFF